MHYVGIERQRTDSAVITLLRRERRPWAAVGRRPESVVRPSGLLLFVPSCFFPDFAFFAQGEPEHSAWDARSLLSRLERP